PDRQTIRKCSTVSLYRLHTIVQIKQGGTRCSCNIEGVVNLSIIGRRQVSFKPGPYLPIRCREPLFYDQLNLTIVFNVFYYTQIIFLQPTQIASDRGESSLHRFLISWRRGETSGQLTEID